MPAKFKGGTRVDSKGYLVIKAGPHRDVRVATLVLEAKLGRKLRPDEDVHHIDGDTLNTGCCGDNLKPLGKSEHGSHSNRQRYYMKHKDEYEKAHWDEYFKGEEHPHGDGLERL
jgi:hypothetical protein